MCLISLNSLEHLNSNIEKSFTVKKSNLSAVLKMINAKDLYTYINCFFCMCVPVSHLSAAAWHPWIKRPGKVLLHSGSVHDRKVCVCVCGKHKRPSFTPPFSSPTWCISDAFLWSSNKWANWISPLITLLPYSCILSSVYLTLCPYKLNSKFVIG